MVIFRKLFLPMYTWVLLFSQAASASEEKLNHATNQTNLKTLILIIATNDKPAYVELQKVWESYMNSDSQHFEAYFIRADHNLTEKHQINKNEIIVKTHEGLVPGIINKTIMALEALQSRLSEFDFIIRTNLSSFYVYPRLLTYLQTIPKTGIYLGVNINEYYPPKLLTIPFVSGAGIILTKDLANLLLKEHKNFESWKAEFPDDVFLGYFFQSHNISPQQTFRTDFPTRAAWLAGKNTIVDNAFHFRAKSHYNIRAIEENFENELFILHELLNLFYKKS